MAIVALTLVAMVTVLLAVVIDIKCFEKALRKLTATFKVDDSFTIIGDSMPKAFVLLNVETGSEDTVLNQLKNVSVVEDAYVSYGVYDLIVRIKADSMDELKRAVTNEIRVINQVRSTLTLIMVEE
jgi:DNA-binding Lrp family transcriptional regulator